MRLYPFVNPTKPLPPPSKTQRFSMLFAAAFLLLGIVATIIGSRFL